LSGYVAVLTEVNLPTEIWTTALNGGGDLRVALNSDGTSPLPLEVVSFDTSAQTAVLWVRFPTYSAAARECWLFYGKAGETQPAVTDPLGRNAVYQYSTYRTGSADGITDVTGTTTTTLIGGVSSGGTVNGYPALDCAGAPNSSRLEFDNSAVLGGYTGDLTVSAWVRTDTLSNLRSILTCREANTRQFDCRLESGRFGFLRAQSPEVPTPLVIGQDYYVVAVPVLNAVSLYVNGVFIERSPCGQGATDAIPISVGGHNVSNNPFDGFIANAELRNGFTKTAEYIATEYDNQSSPATFWTTGTPEANGGGGTGVNVPVTGVAATSAIGTVSVAATTSINVPVTGVAATGAVGDVTVTTANAVNVDVIGVAATGAVGDVTVGISQQVAVTGVAATGEIGAVEVSGAEIVAVTGVAALVAAGDIIVTTNANVPVIGVVTTGAIGNATAGQVTTVPAVGVSATGAIGNVSVELNTNVLVVGVSAFGRVGGVNVWSDINTNQTPDWQGINTNQTPDWQDVNAAQTPGWKQINT
jgi:hypothetical protein